MAVLVFLFIGSPKTVCCPDLILGRCHVQTVPERNSVLAEMEAAQNDLLARLDDLDQRVCRVLKEWTSSRQDEATIGDVALE